MCKGSVVNGVCYGCGGSGIARPHQYADRSKPRRGTQWVIVNAQGDHLAINTDRAKLEALLPTITNAVAIEEYRRPS